MARTLSRSTKARATAESTKKLQGREDTLVISTDRPIFRFRDCRDR
jgi:hypothetical protein